MKLNQNVIAFTGGGTGGHIYPGLAVADELKTLAKKNNIELKIYWIGCSTGMDKKIVQASLDSNGNPLIDKFYGIPSGKLRRYFSFKNFTDIFRIIGGYFSARRVLRKLKPALLFSKGGFVSVPPCFAASRLKIPLFTHECDFTIGLANRLNFKNAKNIFLSYEETKKSLSAVEQKKVVVTGNPVRPVFYNVNPKDGLEFLGIKKAKKPVLLVLGGSSGAKQINDLVSENLDWLCKNYIVVHQTGLVNNNEDTEKQLKQKYGEDYKPYPFIYTEMPSVVACADVILSRAGANSICEAAVLLKPMVLIPLCGSGTRGDQVDNAKFFENKKAAIVLLGQDANSKNLQKALTTMLDSKTRKQYSDNIKKMTGSKKSVEVIAENLFNELTGQKNV